MKYDKFFLVGLLLMALFMIGAASAAEDGLNDNLTADTSIDDTISESINEINEDEQTKEEILSYGSDDEILCEKQDSGMYLRHDAEYGVYSLESDEGYWVTVKFPQKVSGNLSCFIDGKHISDKKITAKTHYFKIILSDEGLLSYGEHEVEIRYTGNDNYKSASIKEKFNVSYIFDAPIDTERNYEATIDVYLPEAANGYVTYTVNGKKYSAKVNHGSATIKTDLELGNNTIVLSYEDKNYPLKTITENIFVESRIVGPYSTIYYGKTDTSFYLKMNSDAKGNLHIYRYEYDEKTDENNEITVAKVPLINGEAKYTLTDIHLGNYEYYAEYDGTDYNVESEIVNFEVVPNLVYQKKMWANSPENTVLVDMPDGDTSKIKIDIRYYDPEIWDLVDTTLYDGTHTGKLYIPLPKLDARSYTFETEWNETQSTFDFEIMENSPETTLEAKLDYNQDYISPSIQFTEITNVNDGDGEVLLYIDGKLNDQMPVSEFDFTIGNLEKIKPGIHDVELKFVNDTYYKPTTIKGKISLSYFTVPNDENQEFGAYVADDATGYVTLTIDGKTWDVKFVENVPIYMNLDNLTYGKHNYQISYSGDSKYSPEQKNGTFEHTYYFTADDEHEFKYGKVYFVVEIPKDGTGNVTVSIDGKNPQTIHDFYPSKGGLGLAGHISYTDIDLGTHKATFSYSDAKYPLKTIEYNFKVIDEYVIDCPYSVFYKQENEPIAITLPQNAKGNLVVNINGEKKTVKLVKGKASYSLDYLTPRYYNISAYYDGNDYKVYEVKLQEDEESGIFPVYPKFNIDSYESFTLNEENIITIEIQKEAKGKIKAKINTDDGNMGYETFKTKTVNLVDGKGTLSLSDLPLGFYTVEFEYDGSDLNIPTASKDILIYIPNNITINYPEKMYANENPKMIFKSPEDTRGELTVTIKDKTSKYALENGTITIPLDSADVGEYTEILLDYTGDKTGHNTFTEEVFIEKANAHVNITKISDTEFQINMEKDATGKLVLSAGGKNYEKSTSNGQIRVNVSKLSSDSQKVAVAYSGDDKYISSTAYLQLNVEDNSKIIASDLSMMYNDGSKYSVTVYGADGKLASGVEVTFKADGKKIGSAKTNGKGVASLKITQVPKTYKISSTALGKTVTKKLTVKQILTLKKVTVKKSAKKLVLTATLKKVKGKFLKSKKITFKFNGKTFNAKTDKKGVAKVTIKSSVLKKLKVGKKVTYSATYVKDTVKQSVKVKK